MNSPFPQPPPFITRIGSVWYRHMRVYSSNLISNGLPPFLEPLIFLAGIGLGLGKHLVPMEGIPFIQYLASGLLITSAMYTASFECSYGTFIRLEFENIYDGMLSAPITAFDLLLGEILWAGTKGFFFSSAVLSMIIGFHIIPISTGFLYPLLSPAIGFLTGLMFGVLSLLVTSFIKNINHFNFYFTGFLSPMFFFSGVVFPISDLPELLQPAAELFPLTHPVRLARSVCFGSYSPVLIWDFIYIITFLIGIGWLAIIRIRNRLID